MPGSPTGWLNPSFSLTNPVSLFLRDRTTVISAAVIPQRRQHLERKDFTPMI